jgi:hypothetical protein
VSRFLGGFAAASVLWGLFVYALVTGLVVIPLGDAPVAADAGAEVEEDAPLSGSKRAKRPRKKRRHGGQAFAGDDLGGPEARELALGEAGGEEQLRNEEIEREFDSIFPQIRRCLILAASDEPVTGKIVFGLRISGTSGVTKVNLQGPSAITATEAGSCMRKAVLGMRLRSFDGPDMLVHLPMTLE